MRTVESQEALRAVYAIWQQCFRIRRKELYTALHTAVLNQNTRMCLCMCVSSGTTYLHGHCRLLPLEVTTIVCGRRQLMPHTTELVTYTGNNI